MAGEEPEGVGAAFRGAGGGGGRASEGGGGSSHGSPRAEVYRPGGARARRCYHPPPMTRPTLPPALAAALVALPAALLACGGDAEGPGAGPGDGAAGAALVELPPEREPELGATLGPELFLARGTVDLGTLWQGAAREVVYPLISAGTEPVAIAQLNAACGCTLASALVIEEAGPRPLVLDEPLAPGTRVEVTVRYDSRGRGGLDPKAVQVYHTGASGRATLALDVEVRPFLLAEPEQLTFGRLHLAEPTERAVTVRAATGEPFGLEAGWVGDVGPGEDLALEPLDPVPGSDPPRAAAWRVAVTLDPDGLEGPGGALAEDDPAAQAGRTLVRRLLLASDVPLEAAGPVAPGTPATHFLDLPLAAVLLAPVQPTEAYLSFGFLAPGSASVAPVRVECFDPDLVEAFRAAPPEVRVLDAEGAEPDWGGSFVPTLRPVDPASPGRPLTPGALAAWDLELLGRGFRGGDRNRVAGRVVLDFADPGLPDPALPFQALLQP